MSSSYIDIKSLVPKHEAVCYSHLCRPTNNRGVKRSVGSVTAAVGASEKLPKFSPVYQGGLCNLPTIPSASDFNTVLSSDQNTLDGTHSQHSQHSTSQDDLADVEEGNQCPAAVQLADAQVRMKQR